MKKLLSILLALTLALSLGLGAYASGEASGDASGDASASAEATPIEAVIDISDGGEHTEEGILIERDDLYVQGVNVSSGRLTLGGEAGHYDVSFDENGVPHATEGDTWNSVIILDDPDHASDKLYGDGARENSLGSGVYTSGADSFITVDNAFIWTTGAVRSAMAINSLSTAVVKNSFIQSDGAVTCYKPVTRLLLSTCRANVFVGGTAYYYNTEVVSGDWGALSTDTGGPNPTYLYAYNVDSDNTVGGYTTYADTNCFVEIYGSRMRSAEYGGFIACSGILRIGSTADATAEALAYADESDLASGEPIDSEIVAGRNDVVIHLVDSMGRNSGYNTLMGVLNISNTLLKTDRDELTERDYYNDPNGDAYGECGYFLDYTAGSGIALRSTNADITLTNVTFDNYENSVTGRSVAIHSFLNYDARGAVSVPDGEASLGQSVAITDSVVDGDILHADYQRPMDVSLTATTLNGAVISGTCAGWNALWTDVQDNGLAENFDAAKIYELLTKNESYETVWGVRLSLDEDSVWNVTGDSSLYSLTLADGAQIVLPDGAEIYVDVDMSNGDLSYDASTGTQIAAFEPGVSYTGVVITLP